MTRTPMVRLATRDDFEKVLDIRDKVTVDLLDRGLQREAKPLTRDQLEEWTNAGVLFVAELDGQVVGAVAVWRRDTLGTWPPGDLAGYVRDLMIDPALRHQALGAQTLAWAERFVAGVGRGLVRLDCDAANERLCQYYEDAGYTRIGDSEGWALFEKRL